MIRAVDAGKGCWGAGRIHSAVNCVSFNVAKWEKLAAIERNDVGKSTLIRLRGGLSSGQARDQADDISVMSACGAGRFGRQTSCDICFRVGVRLPLKACGARRHRHHRKIRSSGAMQTHKRLPPCQAREGNLSLCHEQTPELRSTCRKLASASWNLLCAPVPEAGSC
jgi:energy-coupling factor transporter ATP-binding protein EcfA2